MRRTAARLAVLAAAALYAVEHHQARLADDHAHARRLAAHLRSCRGLTPRPAEPDTNIVIFAVDPQHGPAARFAERLAEQGLLVLAVGPQSIRAVTHLDVSADDVEQAGEILRQVAGRTAAEPLAAAS